MLSRWTLIPSALAASLMLVVGIIIGAAGADKPAITTPKVVSAAEVSQTPVVETSEDIVQTGGGGGGYCPDVFDLAKDGWSRTYSDGSKIWRVLEEPCTFASTRKEDTTFFRAGFVYTALIQEDEGWQVIVRMAQFTNIHERKKIAGYTMRYIPSIAVAKDERPDCPVWKQEVEAARKAGYEVTLQSPDGLFVRRSGPCQGFSAYTDFYPEAGTSQDSEGFCTSKLWLEVFVTTSPGRLGRPAPTTSDWYYHPEKGGWHFAGFSYKGNPSPHHLFRAPKDGKLVVFAQGQEVEVPPGYIAVGQHAWFYCTPKAQ